MRVSLFLLNEVGVEYRFGLRLYISNNINKEACTTSRTTYLLNMFYSLSDNIMTTDDKHRWLHTHINKIIHFP